MGGGVGGGEGRGRVRGARVELIKELKFLGKIHKKKFGGGVGSCGGSGLGGGGQGGCE